MKLNIRQKLLVALATLLIATAAAQQLYNRYALIAAANEEVNRFETTVAQVQINGLKNWLDNQEVCDVLRINKKTLQVYRNKGILPFSRIVMA